MNSIPKLVLGYGNNNADVMFIGEFLSGNNETNSFSFSSSQGQLLEKAFCGLGIEKENIYVTNFFKTAQYANLSDEIVNYNMNCLRNEVITIKPKIIVLMGNIVSSNILGNENENIKSKFFSKKDILYMPTYSILDISKDENKKIDFWLDLKSVINKCKEYNFKI